MRASKKALSIKQQKGGKFLFQRKQREIKTHFASQLMPNLQHYCRDYIGRPVFRHPPYLFSKLPLSSKEMSYFVHRITQYSHDHVYYQDAGIHYLEMVDRTFSGTSSYATRRITLPILSDLCSTLGVPVEAILFGTLNTRKIAHYNTIHYGELPPVIHRYLSRRIRRVDKFPRLLNQEPFCDYSIRRLSNYLGISRTITDELRTPAANKRLKECTTGLPGTKKVLNHYAKKLSMEPEDILEVPVFFFESELMAKE